MLIVMLRGEIIIKLDNVGSVNEMRIVLYINDGYNVLLMMATLYY